MTSTINFRTALTADTIERDTLERDTVSQPAAPVQLPEENDKGGRGRRVIVAGVAAALVAVGAGVIMLNDGPTATEPLVPAALVTPVDASQGPNVDLPASWLDQPTAAPAVAGPNADLPRDLVRDDANDRWAESRRNQGPNADLPRDAALEVTNG